VAVAQWYNSCFINILKVLESNIISDYSLDSYIGDNSTDKGNNKYNYKDNEIVNYVEIAENMVLKKEL